MANAVQGLTSVVGRLLLVSIFLMSALANKIPKFAEVAGVMEKVGVPQPQVALGGAIVFLVVGGVFVLLGYRARFGAALLAIFLVLATYYFHNPAALPADTSPEKAQEQFGHLLKNAALVGAMLFIVANGPGAWSVDGRKSASKAAFD